jgi:uncharacterized membrane protein
MDLYLLLKLVHILGAIVWVGGASVMTLLVMLLDRKGDDEATLTAVDYLGTLGNRVFAPIGMLTILTGLTLAWLGSWGLAAWTVLAAITVTCTFLLGALVLGPVSGRMVKVWKEEADAAAAMALGRRALRLIKLDLGAQFAIITLMVVKPGWTDPLLVVPAAILGLGILAYALGAPQRPATQPA